MGRRKKGKDDYDFDGEMFPMDDFDFNGFGEQKPPKGIKAVFKGLKKAAVGYVKGTVEDYFPNSGDLIKAPGEIIDEVKSNIKSITPEGFDLKKTIRDCYDNVKKTVKAEIDFIKSGKSAEEAMFDSFMNGGDMFGGDDSDSDDKQEDTAVKSAKIMNKAINESKAASMNQRVRLFSADAKLGMAKHTQNVSIMSNIANNVIRIVKQNNMMIKMQHEASSKSLILAGEQLKLLQDIRTAQWKMLGKETESIQQTSGSKKTISVKDIYTSDGNINVSNYVAYLVQSIHDGVMNSSIMTQFSFLTSMLSMVKGTMPPGSITQMIKDSLATTARRHINDRLFDSATKSSFKRLDRAAKYFISGLNSQFQKVAEQGFNIKLPNKITGVGWIDNLLHKGAEKLNASELPSYIANILAIKPVSGSFSWSPNAKNPAEAHVFDNQAHTTLVTVIPRLLSKIYSATSGSEEITYDYSSNKFVKRSDIRDELIKIKRYSNESYGGNDVVKQAGTRFKISVFRKNNGFLDRDNTLKANEKTVVKNYIQLMMDTIINNWSRFGLRATKEIRDDLRNESKVNHGNKTTTPEQAFMLHKSANYRRLLNGFEVLEGITDPRLAEMARNKAIEYFVKFLEDDIRINRTDSAKFMNSSLTHGKIMADYEQRIMDDISGRYDQSILYEEYNSVYGGRNDEFSLEEDIAEKRKLLSRVEKSLKEKGGNTQYNNELYHKLKFEIEEKEKKLTKLKSQSKLRSDSAFVYGESLGNVNIGGNIQGDNRKDVEKRYFGTIMKERAEDTNTILGSVKNIYDLLLQGTVVFSKSVPINYTPKHIKNRIKSRDKTIMSLVNDRITERSRFLRDDSSYYESGEFDTEKERAKYDDDDFDNGGFFGIDTLEKKALDFILNNTVGRIPGAKNFRGKINKYIRKVSDKVGDVFERVNRNPYASDLFENENSNSSSGNGTNKGPRMNVSSGLGTIHVDPSGVASIGGTFGGLFGGIASSLKDTYESVKTTVRNSSTIKEAEKIIKKKKEDLIRKKEEIAKWIQEKYAKNGLDPTSDEAKAEIETAWKRLDSAAESDVEIEAGSGASQKMKADNIRFRIFRRHNNYLTRGTGNLLSMGASLATMFPRYMGKVLMGAGSLIRGLGEDSGFLGKAFTGLISAPLSVAGGLSYGYGRGVQLLGKGAGGLIKGLGKGVTGISDILSAPSRFMKHKFGKGGVQGTTKTNDTSNSGPSVFDKIKTAGKGIFNSAKEKFNEFTSTGPSTDDDSPTASETDDGTEKSSGLSTTLGSLVPTEKIFGRGSHGFQMQEKAARTEEERKIQSVTSLKTISKAMSSKAGILVRLSPKTIRDMAKAGIGGGGDGSGMGDMLFNMLASSAGGIGGIGVLKKGKNFIKNRFGKNKAVKEIAESSAKNIVSGSSDDVVKMGMKTATSSIDDVAKIGLKQATKTTAKNSVVSTVKSAARSAATSVTKPGGMLSKAISLIKTLFNGIGKYFGKGGNAAKILNRIVKLLPNAFKTAKRAIVGAITKFFARMGVTASGVGTIVGAGIYVGAFLWGFKRGAANTKRLFNLGSGVAIPGSMRLACGIAEGLDDVMCGIPGILASVAGHANVSQFIYSIIGDSEMKAGMSAYHEYNRKRARIYGISDPEKLIAYENGSDRGFFGKVGGFLADAFTFGLANVKTTQRAKALGFKSVRAFEEWESRKYKPLEELRKKVASEYGSLKDLENISPKDPEKTKKYRTAFLNQASGFVRDKNLAWLTDRSTDEECDKVLGERSLLGTLGKRLLGSMPLGKAIMGGIDKFNARKVASEYHNSKKKVEAGEEPTVARDANGKEIELGSQTIETTAEKYRAMARENGVAEGNIDKALRAISKHGITDSSMVNSILDYAATTSRPDFEGKIAELKSNTSSNSYGTTSSTSSSSMKTVIDNQGTNSKSSGDSGIVQVNAPGVSQPITTSGKINGSPSKTATLKLSSEMSEAFKYAKDQYDESVSHHKVVNANFTAMINLLAIIAKNTNVKETNNVLAELGSVISSAN